MLTVYLHDGPEVLRIQLVGDLSAGDMGAAEAAWTRARSAARGRGMVIDLSEVGAIDAPGEDLLKRAAVGGVDFVTAGLTAESLIQTISDGVPRMLPRPRLTAARTLRCWFGRAFRLVQPSIQKCLACGCVIRKAWHGRTPNQLDSGASGNPARMR